jgi:hypothetical protein
MKVYENLALSSTLRYKVECMPEWMLGRMNGRINSKINVRMYVRYDGRVN